MSKVFFVIVICISYLSWDNVELIKNILNIQMIIENDNKMAKIVLKFICGFNKISDDV